MDLFLHDVSEDIYKNFIYHLRKKEFEDVYIPITEDNTDKLQDYVRHLRAVPFEDGFYHTYYGEVKKIVASYVVFFNNLIDDVIIDADKYINDPFKDDLEFLVDRTITMYERNQIHFGKEFLPVTTETEKFKYEEILKEYDMFMSKLYELRDKILKIDNQDKVAEYVTEHFSKAAKNTSALFEFTHVYLGRMLAKNMDKIRISLEEIHLRLNNNLNRLTEENEEILTKLMIELYDKNQMNLSVRRRSRKMSMALAEVNHCIQNLKWKIQNYQSCSSVARLEEEVKYWNKKLKEFKEVSEAITTLESAKIKMHAALQDYNSQKCTELPKSAKAQAWKNIGNNLNQNNAYLDMKMVEAIKALMTFFACRGSDRIYYTDNIGVYFVDNFDHQVYVQDDGLVMYHRNCNGQFTDFPDNAYYFDKFGRYFIDATGKKVYQCDPCTSHYNLGEADLLTKTTEDCGHSNMINQDCGMEITDPNVFELLPDAQPVDISRMVGTLPTDAVSYLWDKFGGILPQALFDVGLRRPRNPIHYLAHKLLHHKYGKTKAESAKKHEEAQQYRNSIFQKRLKAAIEVSKKWRAGQAKKPKPEDFDNTETAATYNAAVAGQMFTAAINFAINE